ncbi:thiamine phosphate synthase [Parasphingorhabdus sp.]|uniref:thiamine phosphate synthase n=1 Tax=Parasphingorhabdus sp. TaxID=2709688 RepID=UPI003A8C8E4B
MPRIWLFTDQRNDHHLARAIKKLPRGSGIIFRHYHLPESIRQSRFKLVQQLARRHGHMLILADMPKLARCWHADGAHGLARHRWQTAGLPSSAPVHNSREIHQANRAGTDIFFLSPVFATRSHPGQRPLNRMQVRRLADLCNGVVILLGGMNRKRYRSHESDLTHGWAGIDAFS